MVDGIDPSIMRRESSFKGEEVFFSTCRIVDDIEDIQDIGLKILGFFSIRFF